MTTNGQPPQDIAGNGGHQQPPVGEQPPAPAVNAAQNGNANEASIGQIRMPVFDAERVDMWFAQIEAVFLFGRIVTDLRRFSTIIALIPAKYLTNFRQIVMSPPTNGTAYSTLKEKVIEYFAETEATRLRRLLSEVQLGDRRPSRLLDEMRELSNNSVDEKVLKQIWKQRLPQSVQQILAGAQDNVGISELAKMADSIHEVENQRSINAITAAATSSAKNPNEAIIAAITELTKKVSELNTRGRRRSRNQSRSRAATPAPNNGAQNHAADNEAGPSMCWYHRMYDNKAIKCVQPCSFFRAAAAPAQQP